MTAAAAVDLAERNLGAKLASYETMGKHLNPLACFLVYKMETAVIPTLTSWGCWVDMHNTQQGLAHSK